MTPPAHLSLPAAAAGVLVLTFLLAGVAQGTSADVLELQDASFDSELEQLDTTLVMFYAPWCGHCKRLKPEFDKAAELLKANDPPVALAKVDCTEGGKDACGRFDVRGYPTLKIFRSGEFSQEYNGPREAAGIVKYMKAQVGDSSKEVKSAEELNDLLASKREVVVFSVSGEKSATETFVKVADSMRETVAFAHFNGANLGERKSGVYLQRPAHLTTKLEESTLSFEGDVNSRDEIKEWIRQNYHGLVGHRTTDNTRDFKQPLLTAFYDVDYVKNVKGTNYWRNRVLKVAKTQKSASLLTFSVANKDDFMQEMTEFGLSGVNQEKPQVAINDNGKKYVMAEEFSVENLDKFVIAFAAGKLEAYIKSEDVPASNDGPVKVAVAKNFQELVTDNPNDVLIEFYAPWCGHCKKLTPVYEELGEKMADEKVSIVKMDATANDVPTGFDVRGFPTLYWLPKNTKTPVQYQGGRELQDFVAYIAENSSEELKSLDRKGKAKKTEL